MATPIATYQTLKFIWNESQPIRDWLWSKLPSVRDAKRREAAENQLAKLLDDANALAQALPPEDLDAKIDERIQRFRLDLQGVRIPAEEADLLTERAALFVRMLVTGPFADLVALRARLADAEREIELIAKDRQAFERRLDEMVRTADRQRVAVTVMILVAFIANLVIALLLVRR